MPQHAQALAEKIIKLPGVKLRGLMTIPQPSPNPSQRRAAFAKVAEVFEQLNQAGFKLDTLSMGMSYDLEDAILQGSTMVRIGTALFGER